MWELIEDYLKSEKEDCIDGFEMLSIDKDGRKCKVNYTSLDEREYCIRETEVDLWDVLAYVNSKK